MAHDSVQVKALDQTRAKQQGCEGGMGQLPELLHVAGLDVVRNGDNLLICIGVALNPRSELIPD